MNYKKYEIIPSSIVMNVGEQIQLGIIGTKENGEQETVGDIVWKEIGGGGHIDTYGVLYAINAGVYKIQAIVRDVGEGETYHDETLEIDYSIIDKNKPSDWAQDLREKRLNALASVSKTLVKEDTEKQKPERKFSFMSTTRAIFRTASANHDLVWLVFLIIFCVTFGCCVILLLSGFSVEKILGFCGAFFAMIISIFGKFYSPPGELAQEIHEKMLGATPEEKVKNLEKQKEQIDRRIKAYTTKKRPISQGFFKFSMDERSQPIKE